jgi:transposase
LWAHHQSPIGEQALKFIARLYEVEREARSLPADERRQIRQDQSRPVADALHQWLIQQR